MKKVENGHFVKVDYTGKMENGDVFHSTVGGQPVEVQVGAGSIIKGFEDALVGMEENEKKSFTLPPEDSFGPRDERLVHDYQRSDLPDSVQPKVGDVIGLQTPDGGQEAWPPGAAIEPLSISRGGTVILPCASFLTGTSPINWCATR